MLILGFPSNPTACASSWVFRAHRGIGQGHNVFVVHDLAYADIVYDGWKARRSCRCRGARDGGGVLHHEQELQHGRLARRFMVGNKELVSALARIKGYHDYGTFTPIQVAAIAALDNPQVRRKSSMNTRRAATCCTRAWPKQVGDHQTKGLDVYLGQDSGTYRAMGSLELPELLAEAKVSVSPGIGFGDYGDDHALCADQTPSEDRQAIPASGHVPADRFC